MPAAIDEIRKLGHLGHTIFAADTIESAAGSHSKYVSELLVVPSPRYHTAEFVEAIVRILRDARIDLFLPAFEEAIYLAKHRHRLEEFSGLFFAPFGVLSTLHDKWKMLQLATSLHIQTPRSTVARNAEELSRAAQSFQAYFARPVYSRGGVELLTNEGPLAGALDIAKCEVTPAKPWIVQEFVHGTDVCTFSVAHHGKLSGHSAYVHPREIEHAGGIVFRSVDEPECLAIVQKIVEKTGYHGQISFDFLQTDRGMVLIECNPRPTAGVHMMAAGDFCAALGDEAATQLRVVPPGIERKYSIALVRDMFLHLKDIPLDAKHLFSRAKEVFADPDDLLPALYQLLSYTHVLKYRFEAHEHSKRALMAAYFHDICYNGEDDVSL
ncbi:MAG: ATP-grasp domain-containing protein [Polyangiaceae bacterium]|nr:ATP-grasp domain-containing protein [Polyangiaceae bacterium]